LVQAWFAGVHSDVGGSYLQPQTGLSDITLRWMLKEVGLLPDADGKYPDVPGILLNKSRLDLVLGITPDPEVDATLLYIPPTSSELHKSLDWRWWLPELIPHLYYNKDDHKERYRVPLGLRRRQIPARSLVHETVAQRMDTSALRYEPKNMSRAELVRSADDPVPICADGTQYYRFTPEGRKPSGWLFEFFDRFVLTWLFTIFDMVILLPAILFIILAAVGSVLVLGAKLVGALWSLALRWIPSLAHAVLHWFGLLAVSLLHYLRWLWHF
jgi:hypothetical protein